jgi:hypothetical protein
VLLQDGQHRGLGLDRRRRLLKLGPELVARHAELVTIGTELVTLRGHS